MPNPTKQVLANLAQLGQAFVSDDDLVFEGKKLILPAVWQGPDGADKAIRYLTDWKRQQEEEFTFSRDFPYRPHDGAAAFDRAMRRCFGTSGVGKAVETMFGKRPPEMISVNTGPNEQLQVPWGQIAFSPLKATFWVGATRTQELGVIAQIAVTAPLCYRREIEGFFRLVEEELKEHSIYRGKAFIGSSEIQFIDTTTVDPAKVVYSDNVYTQLATNMWSLLRHSDTMRANKIPLKRAVLLEGPYGTGKTMAGYLTAKEAVANGWTFILARPGQDQLDDVLQTAKLYQPSVVWFEDLDVSGKGESDAQISKLLDALDGITAKGGEVLAGFTSNFAEKIQKGVLRPGRLDAVIHVGHLDDTGVERLCKVLIPGDRHGDIDYGAVANAFEGTTLRLPAFVSEGVKRAMQHSIARNKGELSVIVTEDLVNAATGLADQVALMEAAAEGVKTPDLVAALRPVVQGALNGARFTDDDDDILLEITGQVA